jgi:HK97 family phage major capsid protein/HK97 family phage prohead protease
MKGDAMNRAYTFLEIKSVDEDQRMIEGIATTPTPDRVGDIVDPMGADFKLPMPLLWQHDAAQPIGQVFFAKPNKDGIPFKAKIAALTDAGTLKDRLDEAWQSIKLGLVRAVSIGFTIKAYEILKDGGWRINEWEWLELSAVTIPMNGEATITAVKSIDAELLAASGRKQNGSERTVAAGVTAKPPTTTVKVKEIMKMPKKTLAEQIAALEATRAAKSAELSALQETATEEGRTKDAAEREQFNTLRDEIKSIDDELADLRELEKIDVTKAKPAAGADADDAGRSRAASNDRDPIRVQVRGGNVPKGIAFVRLLAAKTNAYLSKGAFTPLQFAQAHKHWQSETPEVEQILKAAVSAGTTTDSTWAGPLAQYTNLASEFVEYLRPMTIIGRIPGMRRVPFLAKFPRQTGAAVSNWVGQAKPKPATSLSFDSLTLDPLKVAGIVPISMELMRLSSPSAEAIIRDDLAGSIAQLVDHDFIDPEKAASANVSPASITNGVTGVSATGTAYSNLKADVKSIMDNFMAANIVPDTVVMHQRTALSLSLMETSLGNPQFPGLTMNGGNFLGMNTISSTNIDYTEDSPQEGDLIVFLRAQDIALADDGGVEVDVSTEASIEMSTAPTDPVTSSTVLVSLWQQNLVGIRAERMVNWVKRRSAAVQYIKAAKYA